MSWDCDMVIDTGGKALTVVQEVRNVTWNNGGIFKALGAHPRALDGMLGSAALLVIDRALLRMMRKGVLEKLKKLEPDNGWGGTHDALDFLTKLRDACIAHPKARVRFT